MMCLAQCFDKASCLRHELEFNVVSLWGPLPLELAAASGGRAAPTLCVSFAHKLRISVSLIEHPVQTMISSAYTRSQILSCLMSEVASGLVIVNV